MDFWNACGVAQDLRHSAGFIIGAPSDNRINRAENWEANRRILGHFIVNDQSEKSICLGYITVEWGGGNIGIIS